MEITRKKVVKYVGIVVFVIFIPFIISLIANLTTWFGTKDRVEVTLTLDGWITIGSIKFGDLPELKLMLGPQPVENILKVSWRIINTGNKGIQEFESGPSIVFPRGLNIVAAKVSETTPLLKVSKDVQIANNKASIESLGVFNPTNYMKIDFYLRDVVDTNITSQYFETWNLEGKSLDLNITRDIASATRKTIEEKTTFSTFISDLTHLIYLAMFIFLVFLLGTFIWTMVRIWFFKRTKEPSSFTPDKLQSVKNILSKALDELNNIKGL